MLTFTPFKVWGLLLCPLTFLTNKNFLGSDLANREAIIPAYYSNTPIMHTTVPKTSRFVCL
jgi:hypothetical protein